MYKSLLVFVALASFVVASPAPNGQVYTVTQAINTLTDVDPFFITTTQTLVFTASPSTTLPNPTGTPVTSVSVASA
ncbi:hypothetical protein HMN09_01137400 [Mycena chlorophos]|uniref:Uncharacterized protein n=1 Tax=Mycena chlorophos TaxID=658473 RepID=A0A8H6VVW5_MYCCL|nr:hypothetical protein HMN09_01137400 [Mycena chlorophos]